MFALWLWWHLFRYRYNVVLYFCSLKLNINVGESCHFKPVFIAQKRYLVCNKFLTNLFVTLCLNYCDLRNIWLISIDMHSFQIIFFFNFSSKYLYNCKQPSVATSNYLRLFSLGFSIMTNSIYTVSMHRHLYPIYHLKTRCSSVENFIKTWQEDEQPIGKHVLKWCIHFYNVSQTRDNLGI